MGWAYPAADEMLPFPDLAPSVEYHVKGTSLVFTGEQLNHMTGPVDWIPSEHPPMPEVVAQDHPNRKLEACGGCHGIEGQGSIDSPDLAGLPESYLIQQIGEFIKGRRHSSDPRRLVSASMSEMAGRLTAVEITQSAHYFSSIASRPMVRVIETDQVPATTIHNVWRELVPGGGTEPIGHRVIEVAENFDQMLAGDPHSGVIAYVPRGAITRGKGLVREGSGACVICHGAKLKGTGDVPPLAGRDPLYLARALWDIKSGARKGPSVALMQKPAMALDPDQIVDIAAYLGSLER
jgi:cytochrome c553